MDDEIFDEEATQSLTLEYAAFWPRAGASILDNVIFLPLIFLQFYNILTWKVYLLDVLIWVIIFTYKPFMEWKYQATFGKIANKLKVVNEYGDPISLSQSLGRYFFYSIGYLLSLYINQLLFHAEGFAELVLFEEYPEFHEAISKDWMIYSQTASMLLIISVILIFFDQQKQTLHDKMAKTYVVYDRND